jgi:hypothetical protein
MIGPILTRKATGTHWTKFRWTTVLLWSIGGVERNCMSACNGNFVTQSYSAIEHCWNPLHCIAFREWIIPFILHSLNFPPNSAAFCFISVNSFTSFAHRWCCYEYRAVICQYARITRFHGKDERTAIHNNISCHMLIFGLFICCAYSTKLKKKVPRWMYLLTKCWTVLTLILIYICYIYPIHTCIVQSTATRKIILKAILSP